MDREMRETHAGEPQHHIAWRRIASDLATALAKGDYVSGSALPPAQDIAQRYGVNRHTVRQAYLHLQDLGLVTVRQGRGVFVTGVAPVAYRIGKRVSFRENLKPYDLEAASSIINADVVLADERLAYDLCIARGSSLWRLDVVNTAGGDPVSLGRHHLEYARFADFPKVLADAGCSFTAAFRSAGFDHYERRSTRISARLSTPADEAILHMDQSAALIVTRSVDVSDGAPIQVVEAAFRADRIELLVESS